MKKRVQTASFDIGKICWTISFRERLRHGLSNKVISAAYHAGRKYHGKGIDEIREGLINAMFEAFLDWRSKQEMPQGEFPKEVLRDKFDSWTNITFEDSESKRDYEYAGFTDENGNIKPI